MTVSPSGGAEGGELSREEKHIHPFLNEIKWNKNLHRSCTSSKRANFTGNFTKINVKSLMFWGEAALKTKEEDDKLIFPWNNNEMHESCLVFLFTFYLCFLLPHPSFTLSNFPFVTLWSSTGSVFSLLFVFCLFVASVRLVSVIKSVCFFALIRLDLCIQISFS